jgi:hypothetical protein
MDQAISSLLGVCYLLLKDNPACWADLGELFSVSAGRQAEGGLASLLPVVWQGTAEDSIAARFNNLLADSPGFGAG